MPRDSRGLPDRPARPRWRRQSILGVTEQSTVYPRSASRRSMAPLTPQRAARKLVGAPNRSATSAVSTSSFRENHSRGSSLGKACMAGFAVSSAMKGGVVHGSR